LVLVFNLIISSEFGVVNGALAVYHPIICVILDHYVGVGISVGFGSVEAVGINRMCLIGLICSIQVCVFPIEFSDI